MLSIEDRSVSNPPFAGSLFWEDQENASAASPLACWRTWFQLKNRDKEVEEKSPDKPFLMLCKGPGVYLCDYPSYLSSEQVYNIGEKQTVGFLCFNYRHDFLELGPNINSIIADIKNLRIIPRSKNLLALARKALISIDALSNLDNDILKWANGLAKEVSTADD